MMASALVSRREQNRVEQRQRILEAAQTLFGARGFETVTMAEIAELAGVARATVFNYFSSKYALVESITDETLGYYRGMLEQALADEKSSTPALIRALFDHMALGIEQFHTFYRGVFREIVKIQVGLDEGGAAERTRDATSELLRRLMERGQQRGELTSDHRPEDLACAFDGLANTTIVHWLYDDASDSLEERMLRAAEIFLGPVAVDAVGTRAEPLPDVSNPEV